ncbi:hypothetical protein [Halohasta litorea]|uniref:Uncharacterized protein n=1 Tax=Halohasta litorea TaxID=869891 RepID=A0ABD6DBF8_9EURY|nr:hypothetical protein [Halohasta litorea]
MRSRPTQISNTEHENENPEARRRHRNQRELPAVGIVMAWLSLGFTSVAYGVITNPSTPSIGSIGMLGVILFGLATGLCLTLAVVRLLRRA